MLDIHRCNSSSSYYGFCIRSSSLLSSNFVIVSDFQVESVHDVSKVTDPLQKGMHLAFFFCIICL